jgi:pimeloyl-ACP methyl ester carboxylesterase
MNLIVLGITYIITPLAIDNWILVGRSWGNGGFDTTNIDEVKDCGQSDE